MTELQEGDRVRAVFFSLDEGLRLWPVQDDPANAQWRVVRVAGQEVTELCRGDQVECLARYPDAVYGINDNESVPPGTEGTVDHVTELGALSQAAGFPARQVFVKWDHGRRLAFYDRDTYEKL